MRSRAWIWKSISLVSCCAVRPGACGRGACATRWPGSARLVDLDEDPELKALLAELIVEAGREQAHPAMLDVQRLQLELARMDREIQRARGSGAGDTSGLAQQRAEVKREFDRAYAQVLEDTGARDG